MAPRTPQPHPTSPPQARSYQQLLTKVLRHGAYPQLRKIIDKTLPADLSPVLPLLLEDDRKKILSLLIEAGKAARALFELDEHDLEEILESIKRWRNSCGEDAWVAMPYLKALIEKAHGKGIPVIYTTGVRREDNWDSGSWTWKNGRSDEDMASKPATNVDGNEIVAEIAPAPQDIVVLKQKPSGFFGSNMASYLTLLGCDSVIMTGTTTSGCVRATVLDAFSLNYRVAIAEEGCFDRSQASHAINLCDMNAKYADVVGEDEAIAFLRGLAA